MYKLCTPQSVTNSSSQPPLVKIERFERKLFACRNLEDIILLLNSDKELSERFFKLKPNETIDQIAARLNTMIENNSMQDLYNEVQNKFPEMSEIEDDLSTAFKNIHLVYPEAKIPRIVTIVTGFGPEFYIDNDLIVIGLDYFLGQESTYRPHNKPKYLMHTYEKKYIVPKVLLLYCKKFLVDNQADETLLADMLFYGRVYFFVKKILPKIEEPLLFGYTNEQFNQASTHEDSIWEHFVQKKIIFSSEKSKIASYIAFRENTPEISPTCPGGIGRWLGYNFVRTYMKYNKSVTLKELMDTKDTTQIFKNSYYKPFDS